MNNLDLKISSTPPTINGNFEEIKKELEQQLKQFDLIVDADSIKVAKKMATSINKASGQIDTLRKEEVAKLLTPIKDFEEEAKTLTALCQESRQKLLSQVKVFEDEQRVECKRLLDLELVATYEKYGVKEEFQTITVADLAIISNLNKTGIAKKAITAIDERVLEAKRFQEKIDLRLLTLEAICFKGGLLAPLTRENINHFLMEKDDEIYLEKLTKLITNEVTRIELMNERIREKETTAAVAKVAPPVAQVAPPVAQVETPTTTPLSSKYSHFKNAQEFTPKSKKRSYTVTATFEVEVDVDKSSLLAQMLQSRFTKAGFKTIPTISVEEVRYAG